MRLRTKIVMMGKNHKLYQRSVEQYNIIKKISSNAYELKFLEHLNISYTFNVEDFLGY